MTTMTAVMMRTLSKKKSAVSASMLSVVIYLLAIAAPLTGAEVINIVIRYSADQLLIDIKLRDVFTADLKSALSKGIPVDIAFSVSLHFETDWYTINFVF